MGLLGRAAGAGRRGHRRVGAGTFRPPYRQQREKGAVVALVSGLIAVLNGALNLAVADGGPGTGNGVVGGALALVLGLVAMALGGLALARSRRAAAPTDHSEYERTFGSA
ncbi:DUF6223 family protein [Streptomyces sp. NPDC001953]